MELPLFPLNTVLFPNMPLRLYIFEERYKQMINACVEKNSPFGVVLIQDGQEAYETAKPHTIGCTAHITYVQRLKDDRMYILVVGRDRFQINQLYDNNPYLTGDVDILSFSDETLPLVQKIDTLLRPTILEYLELLQKSDQIEFDLTQVPHDPKSLIYLSAFILQSENDDKQALLNCQTFVDFGKKLLHLYRYELTILRIIMNPPQDIPDTSFSPN